jgi:hypothetical protein
MSKKDFIALADAIRDCNKQCGGDDRLTFNQLDILADFCQSRNPNFKRQRWLDYIAGQCGPNGGAR